jgi:hypothetical protein
MSAHNHLHEGLLAEYEPQMTYNGDGIKPDRSPCVAVLKTYGAETRALPAPIALGQELTITMDTDGGDCVVTASHAVNQAGNTILTFDNVGETIRLVAISIAGAFRWRVVANDGVGLS